MENNFIELSVDGKFRLLDMSRVRCVYLGEDCVFITYYGNELNEIVSSTHPEDIYRQLREALIETKEQ